MTTFRVKHYFVKHDYIGGKKQNIRILFFSDLHNKQYGPDNRRLLKAAELLSPDLILIGGDMLIGRPGHSYETAASLIEKLSLIAPVLCGNGNHEQRMKEETEKYGHDFQSYKDRLTEKGVIFLENSNCSINIKGKCLAIAGLELPLSQYTMRNVLEFSETDIEDRIGKRSGEGFQILLAHNPVYFEIYRKWGADLTLSGHLHGGVFRIPFWRGFISPQARFFPKYSGEYSEIQGKYLIVSCGLGTHTVNMRLFNRAELICADLII